MDQEKVGKFISKIRKEKNLTQEQLAEKLGVSINAVSKWERGISFPDVSLYKKICECLEINIEELINGEKSQSTNAKENAIIKIANSKEKTRKKLINILFISFMLIAVLIILSIIIYNKKNNEISDYYERNYQMTFVARNIEAFLKYRYNGIFPDYYGGMYISNDAKNIIVQIVKNKIPNNGINLYYYNELFTVDTRIKIEYVKNSYNELEDINNKINDYLISHTPPKDLNSYGIDIMKNVVVVNFAEANEENIKEFKENIIDSDLIEFTITPDNIDVKKECNNYYIDIGTDILKKHGNLLLSIEEGNKNYVPVSLNLYDDGTYELFTAYESCKKGHFCTMMLKYTKSIKRKYDYDIEKILQNSTNANDMSFDMNHLPEY